jgi:hypothetical protein
MQAATHWDEVYQTKQSTSVSWFQQSPEPSLSALERMSIPSSAAFIDVGGGASNLVDSLLERGWTDISVLDIAAPALEVSKTRLGKSADLATWLVADITGWSPERTYDVWHDRAVFHFLTTQDARDAYRRAMTAGTASNSLVVIATFALDGPEKCSGLSVARYDPSTLSNEVGADFELIRDWREEHMTPGGNPQSFNWCAFKRR